MDVEETGDLRGAAAGFQPAEQGLLELAALGGREVGEGFEGAGGELRDQERVAEQPERREVLVEPGEPVGQDSALLQGQQAPGPTQGLGGVGERDGRPDGRAPGARKLTQRSDRKSVV